VKLTINEEFKRLLTPLTEDEHEKLMVSIVTEGCRDALITWESVLIDGHHRYEICQEYGIEFRVEEMEFKDRSEAIIWMLENQLTRRNLNNFQRCEVALRLEEEIAAQAKVKQKAGGKAKVLQKSVEAVDTQKEVAKTAETSHDTVHKVKTILEKATPIVQERARSGEISVNRAYIETVAPDPGEVPKRPPKPLQFEDVIKKTAQVMDKTVAALTALLKHKELFTDPRYVETFERWEFDLVTGQVTRLLDELRVLGKEAGDAKKKRGQNQSEE